MRPTRLLLPLAPADSVTVEAIRTTVMTYTDLLPREGRTLDHRGKSVRRTKLLVSTRGAGFLIVGHAEGIINGFEVILPRPWSEAPLESLPDAPVLTEPPLVRIEPEEREYNVRTVVVNRNVFTGPAHPERLVSRFVDLGDVAVGLDITGHLGFVGVRTALLQAHRMDREGWMEFRGLNYRKDLTL